MHVQIVGYITTPDFGNHVRHVRQQKKLQRRERKVKVVICNLTTKRNVTVYSDGLNNIKNYFPCPHNIQLPSYLKNVEKSFRVHQLGLDLLQRLHKIYSVKFTVMLPCS